MRLRILLFFCLVFPLVTGWGHWGPQVKVGYAVDNAQGREVFIKDLKDELADNRADLLFRDAKGDSSIQEDQVKDLLAQGIQALVVLPVDPKKAAPLVEAAHQAGINVISLERLVPNCGLDYLIAFNPEKDGELQARAMGKLVSHGEYVLVEAVDGKPSSMDFENGQMKVLKPLFNDGGPIRIDVVDYPPTSTKSIKELDLEEVLKTKGNNIDAVLASDSKTAEETVQARDKAGLSKKLPLAGVGEDLKTCQRITAGTQTLTIYHPPKKLAAETAYLAAKLARKATEFDCQFTDVDNGGVTTKAVLLTPMVVDAKNLDSTIISDGVQKREEVYGK
jgi:D-xylose transport system substrate-binding protein